MKKVLILLFCTCSFIIACNNNQQSTTTNDKKETSKADSLMKEVDDEHMAGMTKGAQVETAQKKVQQALDSLAKLSAKAQQAAMPYKVQLDSILSRLKYSAYAMDRWMGEFNMDSALDNAEERVKYLGEEKLKISRIRETMQNTLQKADSLLKKNF